MKMPHKLTCEATCEDPKMTQTRTENASKNRSNLVLPTDQGELALLYAAANLSVFPLNPKTRLPLEKRPDNAPASEKWGHHRATTDPAQIKAWWKRWPQAAVGLATDDFWVIDLDGDTTRKPPDHLREAKRSIGMWTGLRLEELKRDFCSLTVQSPNSKGWHMYFPAIDGLAIRTASGDIGKAVDTRGHTADGVPTGYVPAPGAIAYGGTYEIIHGRIETLLTEGMKYAPDRLAILAHFSVAEREAILECGSGMLALIERQPPETWRLEFENLMKARDKAKQPASRVVMNEDNAEPMRRQAASDLSDAARELATLTDGRHNGAHVFGVKVGKYWGHGVLTMAEIEAAFLDAIRANGCLQKRPSLIEWQRQLRRGLTHSAASPLPLIARRFRN